MLVRKTVTILFGDVVDSTPLGGQLDPESLRRVMSRWFDEMRAAIERHGGTVEKFAGDDVMAVFGVPVVHADDAVRAVRAAAEMRERLRTLNEELETSWGVGLAMRIGINTGEVVAGDPSAAGTFVTGEAVNLAKRLQQVAEPGEILIGKKTYPLVKDAVTAGPLESFAAKGKREPAELRRLDSVERDAPGVARRLDAQLVGRGDELASLLACYHAAVRDRDCRLVTVFGPAGIGKSRLALELLESVRSEARTVTGRCLPYGEAITFWPLVEIVRALGPLDEILAGAEDGAEIIERVAGATGSAVTAGGAEETFWAVRRLMEALAAERPLVICFEDIHWAEPTLLDLIEYLHGWMRHARVLLLCLARPELAETRPAWAAPKARGDVVTLERLSDGEAAALLDSVGGELSEEARARIAAAAEGNPLFVEQMVAHTVDSEEEPAVPPSIHALLAERLDRLPAPERMVLERGAVAGRDFPRGAIAALVEPELRDSLGPHLLELVRKGLLRPAVSSFSHEDGFRFRHVLIRDAAYDAMPKQVRAELHERFADWLAGEAAAGELDEIVGYHLERAYRLRDELGPVEEHSRELAERAGGVLAAAGWGALARGDAAAAANLLSRAATLLPEGNVRRLELLPELASALMQAGRLADAEAHLDEAVALAAAAGARHVELRAQLLQAFVRSFTRPEGSAGETARVAEAAIPELIELGDESGLAKAWWLLSEEHVVSAKWHARRLALEEALEHATRGRDAREHAAIVGHLTRALHHGPTPASDAIERCEELLAVAAGRVGEAGITSTLGGLYAMRGDFDRARRLSARATAIYEELGLAYRRASRSLVAAEIELLAGDAAGAVVELRRGYDMLESMGEQGVRSTLAAYLARALYADGRNEEARRFTQISEELASSDDVVSQVVWRATRAGVLARSGEPGAEALAREAVELAEETEFPELQGDALIRLGEVLRAAGRSQAAAIAFEGARARFEAKGNVVSAARAEELLVTVAI